MTLLVASAWLAPTHPVAAQATGVIQGRVQLEAPPPRRRSANRYPGGSAETHAIQSLPAVAYLVGPINAGQGADSEARAVMTQRDTTFVPSVVFLRAGGSVSFPNDDPFQHNVYSYSSIGTFDLGRQNPGSSASKTFAEPGILEVFCEVHDFMRGTIVVSENPYGAIVGADGSFRIAGVPAGEYTIAFWQSEHEPLQQTVTVTGGGTATVQVQLRR
ncbi:MAG: carboxypeptidase regulatory-like domain-containing protein [Gemmatimonadota bacterium]|nr:carboxypeptidase regulatory-like domain-containing protein [Gemmatimonadota bacterium]